MGAMRELPGDLWRVGWRQAGWLLKFRTSAPWMEHLASDRYLSHQAFERRYGAVFPGGRFHDLGYAHGIVWQNGPAKKNPAAVARGREVRREP
jgi:hypothetical protein